MTALRILIFLSLSWTLVVRAESAFDRVVSESGATSGARFLEEFAPALEKVEAEALREDRKCHFEPGSAVFWVRLNSGHRYLVAYCGWAEMKGFVDPDQFYYFDKDKEGVVTAGPLYSLAEGFFRPKSMLRSDGSRMTFSFQNRPFRRVTLVTEKGWDLDLPFLVPLPSRGTSDPEYRNIRTVAQKILNRFSPKHFYFVGIGRSPTPLIAFFQGLGVAAVNLPYTGVHSLEGKESETTAYHYLGKYLPSKEELGDREIVVIDYTNTGLGLISAHRLVSAFARDKLGKGETGAISLGETRLFTRYVRENGCKNCASVDLNESPYLAGKMVDYRYVAFAEFGSGNPFQEDPETRQTSRPEYVAYRDAMAAVVGKDEQCQELRLNHGCPALLNQQFSPGGIPAFAGK